MNYRHGYHAGNFADVIKHLAEVAILTHLAKKEAPFAVIDSHAGRGLYDLGSEEALKTGEAASGIQTLDGLSGSPLLDRYLSLTEEGGKQTYPGSPLIAAKLLRPQDRLVAVEKHPEEAEALKKSLSPWRKARVEEGDGYARLASLLPPAERRGLVLIDPPFEAPDEFEQLGHAVRGALRRFATGIYLIWYPVKSDAAARAFEGEILMDARKALKIEAAIDAPEGKLARAGVLVLNPPFGFAAAMEEALAKAAPLLKAKTRLIWLAGEE
ncbi:MAG TPA: 23S rRNA (adenine(2030)-N(6))-methyltransferase RlmJ [Rhizomicrobium sp.]|jgi:23S rRNA (adenine2030-N6)-methyltransferase|nr:23S rRNA (adenine(2030)-N(6))-methyltransferase RlmJ [Rhizomicrobium sp.]